jgi:hypothetical protein
MPRLSGKVTVASSLNDWQDAKLEAERKLAVIALMHCNLSYELEEIRKGSTAKPKRFSQEEAEDVVERLHKDRVRVLSLLALIHSEVSEAVESILPSSEWCADFEVQSGKGGKPEGLVSELADIVIRCMDLAGGFRLRLGAAIRNKHAFNKGRAYKHGGKLL